MRGSGQARTRISGRGILSRVRPRAADGGSYHPETGALTLQLRVGSSFLSYDPGEGFGLYSHNNANGRWQLVFVGKILVHADGFEGGGSTRAVQ